MSALLTGVVLLGNSLFIVPERVQAADGEGLKGTIESKIPFGNNDITCLGPVGGTVGEGQKMFTWTQGGGDDQNWTAEEIEGKGIYRLSLTKNGTTLYLAENGTQVGADAVLTAASAEDTAGQWVFETAKGTEQEGYYRIKNVKNHLYLTTKRTDSTSSRDLTVELNEAMESDSQLWKPGFTVKEAADIPEPEPDPDENAIKGYLTCMEAPAQHLSVDGGLSTDGAKMIIWSGPESNQEWVFQPDAIYNGVNMWNEFIFAYTLTQSQGNRTLPLAVWEFQGQYSMNTPMIMSVLTLTVLPMILLFIFAQDKLIKGMAAGAVKG